MMRGKTALNNLFQKQGLVIGDKKSQKWSFHTLDILTFHFPSIIGLGLVIPPAVCIVGSNNVEAAEVSDPLGRLPPDTPLLLTGKIGLAAALSSTLF